VGFALVGGRAVAWAVATSSQASRPDVQNARIADSFLVADRDDELVPGTLAGGDILIETERLLLRRVTAADLDELIAIHADTDIERFMGGFDQDRATDWLDRVDQTWREYGYGRLAITDRATGRLLGRTGLNTSKSSPRPNSAGLCAETHGAAAMPPRQLGRARTGRFETSRSRISPR
jgi:hypothetical protein